MAQTALFTSPMAKKKNVASKYNPNSYRVISHEAEVLNPSKLEPAFRLADVNIVGQPRHIHPWNEHRHNRPNPNNLDFLRHDVMLLNEPVCNVYTKETHPEQKSWWPSRYSKNKLKIPEYTKDTTMRNDYGSLPKENLGFTRHQSNPNTEPSRGTIPINFLHKPDGSQTCIQEGISYEHQYDSRNTPSYPDRSKRHGAFVWDQMSPEKTGNFIQSATTSLEDKTTSSNASNRCSELIGPDLPQDTCQPIQPKVQCSSREQSGQIKHQTTTPVLPPITDKNNSLVKIDFM